MLHPKRIAHERPEHLAVIMGSGDTVTYGELDAASNRLAHLLRTAGAQIGDHVAWLSETNRDSLAVAWAMQRAGLIYTPINHHLRPAEIDAVLDDCGASVVVASEATTPLLDSFAGTVLVPDDAAGLAATPIDDEAEGREMVYSGGTTGRPKGIRKPTAVTPLGDPENPAVGSAARITAYGVDGDSVYLCPAPLYHAAPLVFAMSVQRHGATVVLMERFDAAACLDLIDKHRVTHAQFVPTMFTRMLKLPEQTRSSADVSSLQLAIHAAAPCPIEVKQRMIEWWGPILFEYYSGTEDIGYSAITSAEWLEHPGSVGKPAQPVHVLDEDGAEVPVGEPGVIWFEGGRDFEYHNDPERTAAASNAAGWRTLGDIGHLDDDGYLYLTDRLAHTIISGGVNIYPQEIEDALVMHPGVTDVAVIGIPDDDLGERVLAVVEPAGPATADLTVDLLAWCRDRLATLKCPHRIDYTDSLPRDPNGKLFKRLLKEQYRADG